MRENVIEEALSREVKKRHGMSIKFVSPGLDGVPDRLILFSGGRIGFVETKAPEKTMRPLQKKRKRQLEALGFLVFCVDRLEQIEEVLDEIQGS